MLLYKKMKHIGLFHGIDLFVTINGEYIWTKDGEANDGTKFRGSIKSNLSFSIWHGYI